MTRNEIILLILCIVIVLIVVLFIIYFIIDIITERRIREVIIKEERRIIMPKPHESRTVRVRLFQRVGPKTYKEIPYTTDFDKYLLKGRAVYEKDCVKIFLDV